MTSTMARMSRPQQDRSSNLRDNENNQLIEHFKNKNIVSLSTAVAQLYLSQKPEHKQWIKKFTGILCFIKDYDRRSYFFRLFNLNTTLLWEQEMYTPFVYHKLTEHFHHFAADDCNAGFNFADQYEAGKFYRTVMEKVMSKTERNESKKKTYETVGNLVPNYSTGPSASYKPQAPLAAQPVTLNMSSNSSTSVVSGGSAEKNESSRNFFTMGKSKGKKVIAKTDISMPTNFRVVQHVGLSTNPAHSSAANPFDIKLNDDDQMAEEMRKILSDLNLPVNKKTANFMKDFINEHGGVEEFKKEIHKQKQAPQPPAPPRLPPAMDYPPTHSPPNLPAAPPPVPPNPNRQKQKPPNAPPPPPVPPQHDFNRTHSPSVMASPPPPPPPPPAKPSASPIGVPTSGGPPPPPPPPPPPAPPIMTGGPPPPPPPTQSQSAKASPMNDNTALLDSIRQFNAAALKRNTDKPVSPGATKRASDAQSAEKSSSIVDHLKQALAERQKYLRDSSDESDNNEDESDSDWQ